MFSWLWSFFSRGVAPTTPAPAPAKPQPLAQAYTTESEQENYLEAFKSYVISEQTTEEAILKLVACPPEYVDYSTKMTFALTKLSSESLGKLALFLQERLTIPNWQPSMRIAKENVSRSAKSAATSGVLSWVLATSLPWAVVTGMFWSQGKNLYKHRVQSKERAENLLTLVTQLQADYQSQFGIVPKS